MDRSNYKRLGDYIRSVDVRNRDLAVTNLLGVSISKTFIPSIANTIGTDMSTYKVVEPYQFAYGPVTSRNGDKITFALYKGTEKCIISQAYETFEIVDKEQLDPDYLMMWALRPEFDRYARFKSNGSAREIFSWDEMCEVYLPVPDITIQRRIVAEYQAVEKRIATNEQLIAKLEETAQAIYKKMFVDNIDPAHLPEGWEISSFVKNVDIKGGGTPSTDIEEFWNGNIKFFSPKDCTGTPFCIDTIGKITKLGVANSSTRIYKQNTVFITARGTVGNLCIAGCDMAMNQSCFALLGLNGYGQYFIYHLTKSLVDRMASYANGAVFSALTVKDFQGEKVVFPSVKSVTEFEKCVNPIYAYILAIEYECEYLNSIRSLLLSKMS